jgi:hypothetical protein
MPDLSLSILGFPAVNRDLTVELRDPVTDTVVKTTRPFLDGTARVTQIDPGAYELAVLHPNLTLPVLRRPVRVLPVGDTKLSVLIDPSKFKNTPIADIPDANLGPVRDATQAVGETVLPLAHKQPGEAITAQDWNSMASGIRDLAQATTELTRLVSPTGHDHPELVAKLEEISSNFATLLDTLSAAMTELQRQIQSLRFRKQVGDVLSLADLGPQDPRRLQLLGIIGQLDQTVSDSPVRFSRVARSSGVQISTVLEQLIDEHQGNEQFLNSEQVKNLSQTADLLRAQQSTSYSSELEHLRKVDRSFGVGGLSDVLAGGNGR